MKQGIYKWIKIGGLLSFIPFILVAGPLAGYAAGDWLAKRFGMPQYTAVLAAGIGFIGSVMETVRVVQFALKTEEKLDK